MSQKFSLTGTTCQSCEVVIERAVRRLPGVKRVRVSHTRQSLELAAVRQIEPLEIEALIKDHGYHVATADDHERNQETTSFDWRRLAGVAVVVLALYYLLNNFGLLTFGPSVGEPAGLVAVLLLGLLASVSSCTAVVGGLVIAVGGQLATASRNLNAWTRLKPHLFFNLGRLAGFAIFGALVGMIGSSFELSPKLNGLFVILIAVVMIMLGLNLLRILPTNVMRMPKWLSHRIHGLSESRHPFAPALLGASTFFLPCGFTQSMQLYALSLRDPWQAGLVMTVFALGTMPALLGIGSLTALASGRWLSQVTKAAGALVLVLGIGNTVNGATLLGFNPDAALAKQEAGSTATITNGVQYIQLEVTDRLEYRPDVLTVKVGVPVEWQIHGADRLGCARSLVAPSLGVNTLLQPGFNTVKFTPISVGRYTFSCSMGMVRGTMIVIN